MPSPVTIENDALRIEVWPTLGGKVSSLVDKADDTELLFNYPAELPTAPLYDTSYANGWHAGWDECFPAVAPSRYVGHPYDAVPVPDHGELWGLPAMAVPTKDGITVVWNGLRFGYRLTRKLYLDGATARAEYTLINLAPFDFRFVWGMLPMLAMDRPVELSFEAAPDASASTAFRLSHDADNNELQKPFDWPAVEEGLDISRTLSLPDRRAWKVYSAEPIAAPMVVRYPQRSRSLRVRYTSEDCAAYWGIWVNTGGWAGHHQIALQPTTGRYDQLDRCISDGSAARVAASGRCTWSVELAVA